MPALLNLPNELLIRIITTAWIFPFHPTCESINRRKQFHDACMLINKRWSSLSKGVFMAHLYLGDSYNKYKAVWVRSFYQPDDAQLCTTLIFVRSSVLLDKSSAGSYIHPRHFPESNYPNLKTIIMEIKTKYGEKYEDAWSWIRRLPYQVDTLVLQFTFTEVKGHHCSYRWFHKTSGWSYFEAYEMEVLQNVKPDLVAPGIKNLEMYNTGGNEEMLAYLVDLFPNLERATSDGVPFDIRALPQIDILKKYEDYSEFLNGINDRFGRAFSWTNNILRQMYKLRDIPPDDVLPKKLKVSRKKIVDIDILKILSLYVDIRTIWVSMKTPLMREVSEAEQDGMKRRWDYFLSTNPTL